MVIACILATHAAAQDVAFLWGSGETPAGEVDGLTEQRVWVRGSDGLRVAYPWDRVREIRGETASEAEPFLLVGRQLWRARTRLERDDAPAAEPLFESVALRLSGYGPTSATTDEGLLRCRLRRGATVLAIEPWLRLVASGNFGVASRIDGVGSIATPGSPLIASLPPFFDDTPAVRAFARDASLSERLGALAQGAGGSALAASLAVLYQAAADGVGPSSQGVQRSVSAEPAEGFVYDIVEAMLGSGDPRIEAVARLDPVAIDAAGTPRPGWRSAWAATAIGISMVRAANESPQSIDADASVLDGVLLLLSTRVAHEGEAPFIAGVALAHAAAAMARLGDKAAAAALVADLERAFPGHEALRWTMTASLTDESGPTPPGDKPL